VVDHRKWIGLKVTALLFGAGNIVPVNGVLLAG
jgi:hypothetical protein